MPMSVAVGTKHRLPSTTYPLPANRLYLRVQQDSVLFETLNNSKVVGGGLGVASTITAKECFLLHGRMRISVEGLSRNRSYAQYLSMWLNEKNGIRSATANHLTGKLLVLFKPNRIMVSEILQEICLCRAQYSKLLDRTAESPNTLAASKAETNEKVTATTIEIALWSIGIAALTFLLTRDVKRSMAVLIAGCPSAVALSRHAALGLAVRVLTCEHNQRDLHQTQILNE